MENRIVFDCGVKSGVIAEGSFRAHVARLHVAFYNKVDVRRHLQVDGFAANQFD
jgi:hypothetical protein